MAGPRGEAETLDLGRREGGEVLKAQGQPFERWSLNDRFVQCGMLEW